MRLSRVFVLLGCMIFAISCAQLTHANHGKADPSAAASTAANANGNPFICTHSSCDDTDASRALDAALDRCSNTRNIYEKQGFTEQSAQFALAVVGALAGAVAAPLSKAGA